MSDDASGFARLKKAKEDRTAGDGDDQGTGEPKNLSSGEAQTESSTDEPKNLSPSEEEGPVDAEGNTSSADDTKESSPRDRSTSTESSSRSSGRRASSRSRHKEDRSGSSSRHAKAFMFDPEEERRFNHLVADVESLVRQEHPEVSVQNSQLVRAMIEMTIEDLEEGEHLILDYILDQIEQDRPNP